MILRRTALAALATTLVRPAWSTPAEVAAELAKVTAGARPQPGHVKLDLAEMVENGNAVGVVVRSTAPAGTRVASLHVFAEANPNPEVFHARFGPASAAPWLATRMRLATSQTVVALAMMDDGTAWTDSVTVMVTLAACLE